MPIYDEHTNNIEWAQQRNLGVLAPNPKEIVNGIAKIRKNYNEFDENIEEFAKHFVPDGADNSAKMVSEILEEKR